MLIYVWMGIVSVLIWGVFFFFRSRLYAVMRGCLPLFGLFCVLDVYSCIFRARGRYCLINLLLGCVVADNDMGLLFIP